MTFNFTSLKFPVIAFSPAGWVKEAEEEGELTDASPTDSLTEWIGLEVHDFAGKKFKAKRAYRTWPTSRMGAWLCKLFNQSIYIGCEFDEPQPATREELVRRLIEHYGHDHMPMLREAKTIQEVIQICL